MEDIITFPNFNLPQCPTKSRQPKKCLEDNLKFYNLANKQIEFLECLAKNTIGAMSGVGTIENSKRNITMQLPYFWCNYCDFKSDCKLDISEHLESHRFKCKFCEYERFSRCEVIKHTLKCHRLQLDASVFWFCVLSSDQGHPSTSVGTKRLRNKSQSSSSNILVNIQNKKIKVECESSGYDESTESPPQADRVTVPQTYIDSDADRMNYLRTTLSNISQDVNPESQNIANLSSQNTDQNQSQSTASYSQGTPNIKSLLNTADASTSSFTVTPKTRSLLNPASTNIVTPKTRSLLKPSSTAQITPHNRSLLNRLSSNLVTPKTLRTSLNTTSSSASANKETSEMTSPQNAPNENLSSSYLRSILSSVNPSPSSSPLNTLSSMADAEKSVAIKHEIDDEPKVKIEIDDDSYSDHYKYLSNEADTGFGSNLKSSESPLSMATTSKSASNLPMLRTMLTSNELSNMSPGPSSVGSDKMSEHSKSVDDDENDEDYYPHHSSGDEYVPETQNKPIKKNKGAWTRFNCCICKNVGGHFTNAKSHMLNQHYPNNLVLRDMKKDVLLYVCPSTNCTYRNSDFKIFIRHLENCGIFLRKNLSKVTGRVAFTSVLVTLSTILERSIIGGEYACSYCLLKMDSILEAQLHRQEKHPKAKSFPLNGLFKMSKTLKCPVIMCMQCFSEFEVTKWPDMVLKHCSEHSIVHIKEEPSENSGELSPIDPEQTSASDTTPRLRAILQQSGNGSASPVVEAGELNEDMPASRMLQFLIHEGNRMMHMLK